MHQYKVYGHVLIKLRISKEIVSSMDVITSWMTDCGRGPMSSNLLRFGSPPYKNDIKTPLLHAYCHLFRGRADLQNARAEMPNTICQGNGLYDAYQACLHEIKPVELCRQLHDDAVVALQHAQLRQCT